MIKMIMMPNSRMGSPACVNNDSGFDSGSSPEIFHPHHGNVSNVGVQDEAPMSRTAQYRKVGKYQSFNVNTVKVLY